VKEVRTVREGPAATWAGQLGDVRLVVADMDGTLLDAAGQVPAELWPVLKRLRAQGLVFAVASGRQYPTLRRYFEPSPEGMAYIAENGAYVVRDGVEISANPIGSTVAIKAVTAIRAVRPTHDVGAVWSTRSAAYAERRDPAFLRAAETFYPCLTVVDDLLEIKEEAIKIAVYDSGDPEHGSARVLRVKSHPLKLVISSPHWLDIMDPAADKGAALRALQATLGVTPDQTMAFGDYLNDLELMDAATHSFAMANAHPAVIRRAEHLAPSNDEHGVVAVLTELVEQLDGR
jgi:Cof subfamily protein (haloacid dehalogenase superfamily)